MKKINLAVIFGGQSSEYSVSLHSAASFLRQIHAEKYQMTMIGIDQEGIFYIYDGSIDDIEHDNWQEQARPCAWVHQGIFDLTQQKKIDIDCAFPILHGKNGEDGCIQGLMELMNIHCVGCDVLSSAMCMDKEIMHIICKEAHIPCADYICLYKNEEIPAFESVVAKIPLPWIIKPCNAGSSYGVHKVETKEQYTEAVKDAFQYDGRGKCLIEKAIEGFEIGCAVMGNDELVTGSCDEIEITRGVFDFEGKYDLVGSNIYCPARIDKDTFDHAQTLAKRVYRALNCTGMARVDMFVQTDHSIVLNEVNTIPGFTATSRYPSMMAEAGISFPTLIDRLIALAMEREVGVC